MSFNDPIADMLTRIRNACMRRHPTVVIPKSKLKLAIAEILKQEGYIKDYTVQPVEGKPFENIVITLKYTAEREPVITGLKRVSRPGLRIYTKRAEIPRVRNGMGLAILSTPKGVMSGHEAWRQNVGGEVLAFVW
ncbi:30S ribosomal protein S8 [Kallotenue papyrolyticum]|uniref:30S ribosomal protein S8 n=1 Tax=Kallotenue papyrolyticum TaxID=1325125 RepID=UPI0004785735|nr:30S ribosomal protein S8 [Kallotenue papyrolyticum]